MKKVSQIKIKLIGILAGLIFIPAFLFVAVPAQAVENNPIDLENTVKLVNPIINKDNPTDPTGQTDLTKIVGGVLKQILGILGSAALLVFVYGGFMWVTAAGNAENVKKGGDAMQWAVIGICIIFSSYAIIDLIFQGLGAEVSKTPTYEQKAGQVWCRDTNKNLCLAVNINQCSGESFSTLGECEGNNIAYEAGWCFDPDNVTDAANPQLACPIKLKSDCKLGYFNQTFDTCAEKFNQALDVQKNK